MKNTKIISTLLSASMVISVIPFAVSAEETIIVSPATAEKNISVLKDITLTGITDCTNLSVEGTSSEYYVAKTDNGAKIVFAEALGYGKEITVKNGDTVLTKFTTEQNPITTLFYEDFDDGDLSKFTDVGENSEKQYEIYDGKLLMKTCAERNPDGGTPGNNDGSKGILYVNGSDNWTDYTVDIDLANGWYTRAGETGEYYDCESIISVWTDKTNKNGVLARGRFANPGIDAFCAFYPMSNYQYTNGQHHGWQVFNSQYRTVHHMTINAIGRDVDFKFTGYGNDQSYKWTNAVEAGTKGGVTLRSAWGRIVYDNLLVTDKNLVFTPSEIKNVGDILKLTFNKEIPNTDSIFVKDENGTVNVKKTLSEDNRVVTIDTTELKDLTKYTVTVDKGLAAVDGSVITNEKSFDFTTDSDFGLLTEGTIKDFGIIDDVELEFSSDIGANATNSITVEGKNVPAYDVIVNGNKAKIVFASELAYNSEYVIKVSPDLADVNGIILNTEEEIKLKTEQNPITTLFYEDFDDGDLSKFTDVGENSEKQYEIYDGKLLMKTCAERNPDGGTPGNNDGSKGILYVNGSDNWTDYTVDIDLANGWYTRAGETGEYYDCESIISVWTDKTNKNGVLARGRFVNPGIDAFCAFYPMSNYQYTNGQHHGWQVFNSQYRTVHHMTINAIGRDVDFKFTGYGNDQSYKWTNAVEAGTKGGVTLRSSWGRIVYDNLLVTDKNLIFTPSAVKNVEDTLKLIFNKAIAETDSIVVSCNGETVNVEKKLSEDKKIVTIDTSMLDSTKKYTVTVKNTLKATDGSVITNEKAFDFKLSTDFKIAGTTIKADEENVSVITDPEITFSQSVKEATAKNIKVTGIKLPHYDIMVNGNKVKLVFAESLPYNTNVKITIPGTVENTDGIALGSAKEISFTTEKNPITTLYWQDFDDITAKSSGNANGDKFGGLTVDAVNHSQANNSYEIVDGTLFMNLYYQCGQDNDNGHIRFLIDGSDKWSDYEISADFKQNVPDAEKWVFSGFGMRYNGTTLNNSAKVFLNYLKNAGSEQRLSFKYIDNDGKSNRLGWDTCNLETDKWYRLTASVVGQTVSGKIEKDGEKIKEATYDIGGQTSNENALNKQGYAYIAPMWYCSYVDNILAVDKGLLFDSVETKYTDGKIKLVFNESLTNTESELSQLIKVVNQDGEVRQATVGFGENNRNVIINIVDPSVGDIYSVTVGKGVKSENHSLGMNNDKTFKLVYDVSYAVVGLDISNINNVFQAQAKINVLDYTAENEFTLILVVYDSTGKMIDYKFDNKKISDNGYVEFMTETIEIKDGYTASAFIWNNINDMKALSGKVDK